MKYTGPVYRPPFEDGSLLLQATVGCSHNSCTFCSMYRDVPFQVESMEQIEQDLLETREKRPWYKRVFLLGGDAFTLDAARLKEIARKGFALLDIPISEEDIACIAQESALSPQLMQENCFNLAYRVVDSAERKATHQLIEVAFFDTAENYRHYNDTVQQVLEGPARGRSRRKQYRLKDGSVCDIYALLLVSISASPPILKFSLDEISRRMSNVLAHGEALPNRLGLSNIVRHIEKIIKNSIPDLDTVDWKRNTLYILDPFLLFYLRWGRNWRLPKAG